MHDTRVIKKVQNPSMLIPVCMCKQSYCIFLQGVSMSSLLNAHQKNIFLLLLSIKSRTPCMWHVLISKNVDVPLLPWAFWQRF